MVSLNSSKSVSAIFITFSGNCRKALTHYQACFGGTLQFETFGRELEGYTEMPVVSGSLVSDSIIIHGSDLVHNEGRTVGNYISIFMHCPTAYQRRSLMEKLTSGKTGYSAADVYNQKLVEIIDPFDVRWVLYV
ncbi:PhnB protein [Parapedobacter composti]|uniref:PhnB protein n=1 Tax=Parapedobacter composti TaxID=623281 RepID=A0A1I1LWU2_9SPHI|nr:glyoxalase [Parapedobacter composti]SFC73940.1 PhnB protein [Parapedobacter composti]